MDKTAIPASDSDLDNWIAIDNVFDPKQVLTTFSVSCKPQSAFVIGLRIGSWSNENNIDIKACNVLEKDNKYRIILWVQDEADAMAIKLWWS